jgi:hypothetical protein
MRALLYLKVAQSSANEKLRFPRPSAHTYRLYIFKERADICRKTQTATSEEAGL